jgi:hypothetical protein
LVQLAESFCEGVAPSSATATAYFWRVYDIKQRPQKA